MFFRRWRKRRRRDEAAEDRLEQLRQKILNQVTERRKSEAHRIAIEYCEVCIAEYEELFEFNEKRWFWWQKITIIGGVVATLSAVINIPSDWLVGSRWLPTDHLEALSWIRGIPAAFVTIAASYLASFNYKEDAVRHEVTSNELWNELAKYSAGAEPYNKETTDTSNFLNNVCKIVDNELRSWRAVVEGKPEDENDNDDVIRKEREKAKAGEEKQKADAEAAPEAGKTDVAPRKGHFDRLWAVKVIRPNVLSGLLPIRVCNLVFAGAYLSTT